VAPLSAPSTTLLAQDARTVHNPAAPSETLLVQTAEPKDAEPKDAEPKDAESQDPESQNFGAMGDDAAFEAIVNSWWEDRLKRSPLLATSTGDHRYNDRLPEVSIAAADAEAKQLAEFSEQLSSIAPDRLSPANQINHAIVRRTIASDLAEHRFHAYLIPITNREGFHISFPDLRNLMPFRHAEDYRNYIARLVGFRKYAQQHVDVMRVGIEQGFTLPSIVLQRYREPLETHLVSDVTQSLFYEPLKSFPPSVPEAMHEELRESARNAIRDGIVPGYALFLEFMEKEYVPAARGSIGAAALPDGRAFYRHRIQRFTTLPYGPEEIHQLGLAEVARIRREMKEIMAEVGFEGEVRDFADHLRNDPQFQADSPEQLMKEAAIILKRIDGELPRLFRKLPRTPYGLLPIPDYIAPQTTTAYYMPPPGDGSRAGYYYLNTYDLKSRPLYELEALSLHEAVPGHHLQLALQQEMQDLPAHRRFADFTSFIEGWALYAERLGLEVDFYKDPYSNFGRLTYEMWRACRLVVDSGVHYLGWTREQAIEFMADNTALSLHNIRAEVDRYIAWPGQALAYKTGELKIRELRAEAEAALGSEFDIREFHDVLLRNGSIPLDVLAQEVHTWLDQKQQTTKNGAP
jgi:uncharacterized protein (DUF885 family)